MSNHYDFSSAVTLFDDYLVRVHSKRHSELHSDLGYEASERLRQMQFLLQRIAAIVSHVQSGRSLNSADLQLRFEPPTVDPVNATTGDHIRRAMFVVRAYTEGFYYLAARFRGILKTKPEQAGGLSG